MEMSAIRAGALAPEAATFDTHKAVGVQPWVVVVTAAIMGIAIQALWIPIDADVSWLITVCERVLSGDRLYVDIMEVNPPASVWLYLPLVTAAKATGIRPEAMVVMGFAAAGLASTFATLRLASRLDHAPRPIWLATVVASVSLVLPMALFAQREHAALLLALPALACIAVVAEGKNPGRTTLLLSGFAAGLIVDIKPYFLAAMVAPLLWAAWKRRSFRPFLPAMFAGAAAVLLYAGAILAFAPEYLRWVPVIARTYAPMHDEWWKVIVGPSFYPAICIALAVLLKPKRIPALSWVWGLGAAGFLLAAIAQAKNYPNHWLPQAALALAAAASAAGVPGVQNARRRLIAMALALVGFCEMYHWVIVPDPSIAAAIRAVAPPDPKIIALSPQLTTGHPVTRNVEGHWVGSRAGLFTASGAKYAGMKDEATRQAYREDINSFAADVAKYSPDIILVLIPAKKWLMSEPAIARTMKGYRDAAVAGDTEVWVRRSAR
jgi:hypothetical protein